MSDSIWNAPQPTFGSPNTYEYTNPGSWSSGVPGAGDTGFFGGQSTVRYLSIPSDTVFGQWDFTSNLYKYAFDNLARLDFVGEGIIDNSYANYIKNFYHVIFYNNSDAGSTSIQNVSAASYLEFVNTSSANSANIDNFDGKLVFEFYSTAADAVISNEAVASFRDQSTAGTASIENSGQLSFHQTSTAGHAAINNSSAGSLLQFSDSSTADRAQMVNSGILSFLSHSTAGFASIQNDAISVFQGQSTAGVASIANGAPGLANLSQLIFIDTSTAGSAYIHTYAKGTVLFEGFSNPGAALLVTDAGGSVDFSLSAGPAGDHHLTIGAIGGAGTYRLGSDTLTVGGLTGENPHPVPTTVRGAIDDGGAGGGSGASLVKVGPGLLKLRQAHNTYSGGTTLEHGTLDLGAVGAAGTRAITFAGPAKLKIENAGLSHHVFHNAIHHFGHHDVLDLCGLDFQPGAAATYDAATHHLTVHSGGVTDALRLLSPHATHFEAASDGHGGTEVFLVFA
jgi:autotransporter-associated beta strand protein